MKGPPLHSIWLRYDGAILEVITVLGRDVMMRMKKRGTRIKHDGLMIGGYVKHVISDFNNEIYDGYFKKVS